MSRGKTGNNPRRGNLRSQRVANAALPQTGELSPTRLALLGHLTRSKHTILTQLRNNNSTAKSSQIISLMRDSKEAERLLQEMLEERLIEKAPHLTCIKCSKDLSPTAMVVDDLGTRHRGMPHCKRCRLLGKEYDLSNIKLDNGYYNVIEDNAFNVEPEGVKITDKGKEELIDHHQKVRAAELKKLEIDMESGATTNVRAFEEVIMQRLDHSKKMQSAHGSPSTMWKHALESDIVTQEQYEKAANEYGSRWNYAGS